MPGIKTMVSLVLVLILAGGTSLADGFFLDGEKGLPGEQGNQGGQGLKGPPGDQGLRGDPGPQGFSGIQGLKGDTGDPGYFTGTYNGNVTMNSGTLTVTALQIGSLNTTDTFSTPPCPEGYAQTSAPGGVILCKRGSDEMVRVGDFWIDRYEAAIVDPMQYASGACNGVGTPYGGSSYDYSGSFPRTGDWISPLYACSLKSVKPSAYMTWFQAQEACAHSGKRLCTNEEWQAAAAGTYDTTGTETGAQCHIATTNTSARNTGLAGSTPGGTDSCISRWGAEDMIGNVYEWVAMWGQGGPDNSVANGAYAGTVGSGKGWDGFSPETSGDGDGTWNLAGAAWGCDKSGGNCGWKVGLPFAAIRGGYWANAPQAGLFAIFLDTGPSAMRNGPIGFRCCRGR